jgi:phage gp36-like protein
MAYAVQNDLNIDADRLIELTDSAAAPNVVDTTLLARLLAQSEAIVNAQLGGTTTVPFTAPIPAIITFITAGIWAYRIYRHREVMDIPATIKDDYELAWSMMRQIVAGEIEIDPADDNLSGVPEVQSSCSRGWTPRDLVTS